MLAARLYKPYDLRLEDVEEPKVKKDWVKIKVEAVGICGTDKAFYKGTYKLFKTPLIPGHEICGRVIEVGDNIPESIVGKRVVTEINITCGKCWFCTHSLYTHCPYRETIGITVDGGMAEYVSTPYRNIHEVKVDPEIAVFTEPLAAVIEMVKLEPPAPGSNIAILGSGNIGLLSLQVLKQYSPLNIVVIVRKDSPKAKFARKLGADYVVTFAEAMELRKKITPEGQGYDYVVEVTGNPKGLSLALKLVRPRGVIAAKSTHGAPVSFNYTEMVVKEVKIVSSRCGPFPPAIKLLEKNTVKVSELITSIYPLRRVKEAFEKSLKRDQVKVIVKP